MTCFMKKSWDEKSHGTVPLGHCRVIAVQSFGSHIRPQPPGLGLKVKVYRFLFLKPVIHTYRKKICVEREIWKGFGSWLKMPLKSPTFFWHKQFFWQALYVVYRVKTKILKIVWKKYPFISFHRRWTVFSPYSVCTKIGHSNQIFSIYWQSGQRKQGQIFNICLQI